METPQTKPWLIQFKGTDVESFKLAFLSNLEYRLAKDHFSATAYDCFLSAAYAVAERLVERWIVTQQTYHKQNPKRVYYLSMEYLIGKSLENSLINLGLYDTCRQALAELGMDLEELREYEVDAGLGNGGLGRLAACFLDSMATLDIPAHGYGIRYEYGLFHQKIVNGEQVETPDNWLALPNPWEIARPEFAFTVRLGGRTERYTDECGQLHVRWVGGEEVLAMPFDTPIPGYCNQTVNTMRLWSARSTEAFKLDYFNSGDYMSASEEKVMTENITKVLYPNDNFFVGKELRLKQEYFLVSASLQDIIRRFKTDNGHWDHFPERAAIHLNDTHPSLAIPELMRLLVDDYCLDWSDAWDITVRTFAYTNHTVLPEALEEWPVSLLEGLLPRHLEIIYEINLEFLKEVSRRYPGDVDRLRRMSLIGEDGVKRVRMAHLSVVGSHSVNGVSALHTDLLKQSVLRDFYEFWPEKFSNKTNGITPRRWLRQANAPLSDLITEAIGDGWVKDLSQLSRLEPFAEDSAFRAHWRQVKRINKEVLATLIRQETGIEIAPNALFDVQVKRFHAYKRQLLFALFIVARYLRLKEHPEETATPRVCLIGGKAAPGYYFAKLIIRLINHISEIINDDPDIRGLLKVVFLPNYRVSLAERIFPAADLSEQIAAAGKEASGTSNMKFALNGALTIGTHDGANIEIMETVGKENFFAFGHTVDTLNMLRAQGYHPRDVIASQPELQRVIDLLGQDFFSPGDPGLFRPLYDELVNNDQFFLAADFAEYYACQERVMQAYRDAEGWARMSILNVARCGIFSSDRAIAEYARDIWQVTGVDVLPEMSISDEEMPVLSL